MTGLSRRSMIPLGVIAVLIAARSATAGVITVDEIPAGGSTYTTVDSLVTLTPLAAGGGAGTFGKFGSAATGGYGVAGGTNGSAVDDGDGDPSTTVDQEALRMQFAAGAGISGISFVFSRADGDNNGIAISGFLSDPGAVVGLDPGSADISVGFNAGTVLINHPWQGGSVSTINFSNPGASSGQTLSLVTIDVPEGAPQAAINRIEYVPEPASAVLGVASALAVAAGVRRRW
jgi:hypothetical protein